MADPELPPSRNVNVTRWFYRLRGAAGALGVAALAAAVALSLGLSAIVWLPAAILAGIAMFTVWAARRHRQVLEGRDPREVKDARHAPRQWPTAGVTDDRLPES